MTFRTGVTTTIRWHRLLPIFAALGALALLPATHAHFGLSPLGAGSSVPSADAVSPQIASGALASSAVECPLCVGVAQARTALATAAAGAASVRPGRATASPASHDAFAPEPDLSRTPPRGPPARI